MPKHIAAYVRVSTDHQRTDSQRTELQAWAKAQGLELRWYSDKAQSGSKGSRPALDRMLADVEAGRVEVVVAARLDRLGRSLRHVVDLVERIRMAGGAVVIPSQGIDTRAGGAVGDLVLGVLAAAAQFERAVIVERVRAGLEAKRAKGWRPAGRAPRLRGVEVEAARRMREEGESIAAIARELGCSRTAARRALSR